MSEETVVEQEPVGDTPQKPRGLSSAQKALVLGLVLAAAFLVGATVMVMLTERGNDEVTAPPPGLVPPGGLEDRVSPDDQEPLPDRVLDGFGDGPPVDLAAYRGQPLILNFWASWCAPCVKEMPDFQEVAVEMEGRVVMLGVNVQDAPANAQAFVDDLGITYDLARDAAGELYQEVRAFGMPTTLLVDEEGLIVWRHTGLLDAEGLRQLLTERLDVQ